MNLIFLGTPSFALPSLKGLAQSNHQISAVVTQPDRPRGRSGHPLPPPVKELALESGLRVLQPDSVNEESFLTELRGLAPDIIVVVAFGQRLSRDFIELPKICCINLHASLLPRYRGAAPINWAIIRGETRTGVTVLRVAEKMDSGDIIAQDFVEIDPEENAGELGERLAIIGANLLTKVVDGFEHSSVCFLPQRHELVTMAPKLKRGDGLIKWAQPAQKVHDFIRGMNPRPRAYTSLPSGKRLLILRSRLATEAEGSHATTDRSGTIMKLSEEGILVATYESALWITHLQPEGGKAMTAAEYLRGHPLHEGEVFN
ncbi:MAG TPA: methionyl-tRNA formyltransferase [Candidatus Tripitaka californicus]|uniref:methionyl-tRNA formyltransferase n=1 Tax=Candidatus Tripitaka californicus TaxID=3367616 RepID=UPI00402A1513